MESVVMAAFGDIYRNKSVLITGHTGFKGTWLAEWLVQLGATVTGVALPPPTNPALFDQLGLSERIQDIRGDVRELQTIRKIVEEAKPDFIFHLAAQSLVRLSYNQPVETYSTNVMGTVNILEAVRLAARPCVVVIVTTDKCYENKEWVHSYREEDPMGGYDPYSSSKGAAELVVSAYRRSFFAQKGVGISVASARAGNVIGGGDWALDRIVPDCVRSLLAQKPIPVRNKVATRPWQHVLEPLSGYLCLAAALYQASQAGGLCASRLQTLTTGFNFGPALTSNRTVADLVVEILKHWSGNWEDKSDPNAVHEAKLLNLATDKAYHYLGWQPVWDFPRTTAETIEWYKAVTQTPGVAGGLTRNQIRAYCDSALAKQLPWTRTYPEPQL